MSQPSSQVYLVIPDIHGHLARFQAAMTVARRFPQAHLVFLGDLIDDSPRRRNARKDYRERGAADESHEILRQVQELYEQGKAEILLGNHEVMAMSAVLEGHRGMQDIWWIHGGRETAAGYGWRGHGEAGRLAEDLLWLRTHGRLWTELGPSEAKILVAHATRPGPGRVEAGLNLPNHLLPVDDFDPVVWAELDQQSFLHRLPSGFVVSVHGHMEGPKVREWAGTEAKAVIQLDLSPGLGKLALLHVSAEGKWKVIMQRIG